MHIWKGKSGSYNVLNFSYLNIPPSKRGKGCKSTFLSFTMNMANDCACEQSIFSLAFMGELTLLNKGYRCQVMCIDGISRDCIIYARAIQYLFDTKAFEKRLHVQCSTSKQCTPCGMPGIYSLEARCVIYTLYRVL